MKKHSDIELEYSKHLSELPNKVRAQFMELIDKIETITNAHEFITVSAFMIPIRDLVLMGISRKNIVEFVYTLKIVHARVYSPENIAKKDFISKTKDNSYPPKIIIEDEVEKLSTNRGMDLYMIKKVLKTEKQGENERIEIIFDLSGRGIYLPDSISKSYQIRGDRSALVEFYIQKNKGFPGDTSSASTSRNYKKQLSKNIKEINRICRDRLPLQEDIIIKSQTGYMFNSEMFTILEK